MQYLEIKDENEAVVASGNYIFLNHHNDKLNTQKTKKYVGNFTHLENKIFIKIYILNRYNKVVILILMKSLRQIKIFQIQACCRTKILHALCNYVTL